MSGLPPPDFEKTITIQVTIPAGQAANSVLTAKLIDNPIEGAKDSLQVPINEVWLITDLYVKSAPSIDCILEFYKNGTKKMIRTDPLSTNVITYDTRPGIGSAYLGYGPGDILSIQAINLDKNSGTAAVTVTAYAKVKVYRRG